MAKKKTSITAKTKLHPHEMEELLPRVLRENKETLFPNSPIEVVYENKKFAVYCEGEWSTNEESMHGVTCRIGELLRLNRELWETPATYANRRWPGWARVDMGQLYALIGVRVNVGGENIAS
ncbi:MAG: hypothetical protein ACTHOU_14105 [Aureliella sp.]